MYSDTILWVFNLRKAEQLVKICVNKFYKRDQIDLAVNSDDGYFTRKTSISFVYLCRCFAAECGVNLNNREKKIYLTAIIVAALVIIAAVTVYYVIRR